MTHQEMAQRRCRILDALLAGRGEADICREFGVKPATVQAIARYSGVRVAHTTPQKTLKPSTYKILAALLNTDLSLNAIAEQEGFSYQWVQQIYHLARQAGIKVPTRRFKGKPAPFNPNGP